MTEDEEAEFEGNLKTLVARQSGVHLTREARDRDPVYRDEVPVWARGVFLVLSLTSYERAVLQAATGVVKPLWATYDGTRVRVCGAKRNGEVMISRTGDPDHQITVSIDDLNEFAQKR
jgi:hypothetical protein